MGNNQQLAVMVLTRNEEGKIAETLAQIKKSLTAIAGIEPIYFVVDDSKDRTSEIAQSLGFKVLRPGNKGLGHAYRTGLDYIANHVNCDLILTMDGDGQVLTSEFELFLNKIKEPNVDMVVGSRFLNSDLIDYKYKKINRWGVVLLSTYISLMTGKRFTDSHGGIRVFKHEVAKGMRIFGHHSYVQETIVDATERGFNVVEVSSRWLKREYDKSRVVNNIPKYAIKMAPYLLFRIFRKLWA